MNSLECLRCEYEAKIFHGLEVYETGDVFRNGKRVAMKKDRGLYERISVKIDGKTTSRTISRLVYTLFIEPDFNPRDNRYYIDTNGRKAGEYILGEIKKIRALGTHKRAFTDKENWGNGEWQR